MVEQIGMNLNKSKRRKNRTTTNMKRGKRKHSMTKDDEHLRKRSPGNASKLHGTSPKQNTKATTKVSRSAKKVSHNVHSNKPLFSKKNFQRGK